MTTEIDSERSTSASVLENRLLGRNENTKTEKLQEKMRMAYWNGISIQVGLFLSDGLSLPAVR